jgi:hypothetical protein
MPEPRPRELMESRYGSLGCGQKRVTIAGVEWEVGELLQRMGLLFDDAQPIDVQQLAPGQYVARYFEAQNQWVVAQEFDEELRLLRELRAHIAEWVGDEAYFSEYGGH